MSSGGGVKEFPAKSYIENSLIVLCLAGSVALFWLAWKVGDASPQAQERQWQIVFVGLTLALAGQWIVGGSAQARKHQIAATCLVMAGAGVGIQLYYELPFAQVAPFVIGYGFLFVAAELCAFIGARRPASRRTIHVLRFGVVAWNAGWAALFVTAAYGLPDVANLYIAFTLLWTVATAVIAWSEFCTISAAEAARAPLTSSSGVDDLLSHAE
jgi:hypothetical protein